MLSRRNILGRILASLAAVPLVSVIAHAKASKKLWQPVNPSPLTFMNRARDLARLGSERGDGTPYGAVIIRDNIIVGEGWNRSHIHHDATAHAETEAIRDAAKRLGTRDLSDCQMVTNGGRPCPMCETAAYWAQIKKMWLEDGEDVVNAGGPKYGGS
ncbi:MAG: nucleoside deaminase [Rhodospirillales bacterium]|nr:nucleoside deaminase [Rhodospirillales bacterium]